MSSVNGAVNGIADPAGPPGTVPGTTFQALSVAGSPDQPFGTRSTSVSGSAGQRIHGAQRSTAAIRSALAYENGSTIATAAAAVSQAAVLQDRRQSLPGGG